MAIFKNRKKAGILICLLSAVILAGALTFAFADAPETDTVVRWSPVGDVGVIDGVTVVWPNATDTDLDFAAVSGKRTYETDRYVFVLNPATGTDEQFRYVIMDGNAKWTYTRNNYSYYSSDALNSLYGEISLSIPTPLNQVYTTTDITGNDGDVEYNYYWSDYYAGSYRELLSYGRKYLGFSFEPRFDYDDAGNVASVHLDYGNMGPFTSALSDDGIARINVTPVLKRFAGCNSASSILWESVPGEEIAIWHNLDKDTYYSDYSVPDDLPAGEYCISFILTFRDHLNNYFAIDIDGFGSSRMSDDLKYSVITGADGNVGMKTVYLGRSKGSYQYSDYKIGYADENLTLFTVRDDRPAPFEIAVQDFEYGRFDVSGATWRYTDGSQSGYVFTDLWGFDNDLKDYMITPKILSYSLKRVCDNGLFKKLSSSGFNYSYDSDQLFFDPAVLSLLNVGTYEMEVTYDSCEVGGKTYLPGKVKTTFTVKPATITASAADIYVVSGAEMIGITPVRIEYDTGGYTYDLSSVTDYWNEGALNYNAAALPDFIAYQQGYDAYAAANGMASATELYEKLKVEYDKVAASYSAADAAWLYAQNWIHEISVYYYKWVHGQNYKSTVAGYLENLMLCPEALMTAEVTAREDPTATWGDLASESPLYRAYATYRDYLETYKEYASFCADYGIILPERVDESAVYDDAIGVFRAPQLTWNSNYHYWDHTARVWVSTSCWMMSPETVDEFSPSTLPMPPLPGGLCAPAALTTAYTGSTGFPPIILLQYREGWRMSYNYPRQYRGLEMLYNQAAVFVSENSEYFYSNPKVTVMPHDVSGLYDYGNMGVEYVAYRVNDAATGQDIRYSAVKPGTYPLSLVFEGNYSGTVSGLNYQIGGVTADLDNVSWATATEVIYDYNGSAVRPEKQIVCTSTSIDYYYAISLDRYSFGGYASYQDEFGWIWFNQTTGLLQTTQNSFFRVAGKKNGVIADLGCVIQRVKDAYGNAVTPTTVTDAVAAGTYTFTYTIFSGVCDCAFIKDGEKMESFTTTVVIKPFEVDMAVRIPFCEDGDLAAVRDGTELRVITAPAGTQRENAVQFDISRAVFVEETSEAIEAFCVSGTSLPLDARLGKNTDVMMLIPVTLTDAPSCTWGQSVQAQNVNGQDWLVYEFTVGLETVAVEWNPDAVFTVGYDGTCKYDPAVFTASFTDREGNRHPLEVYCLNECVNVGVYALDVRFASGTDDADHYRLGLHSLRFITILPVEATPTAVVIYPSGTNLVYGDDAKALQYAVTFDTGLDSFVVTFTDALTSTDLVALTGIGISVNLTGQSTALPFFFTDADADKVFAGTHDANLFLKSFSPNFILTTDTVIVPVTVMPRDMSDQILEFAEGDVATFTGLPIERTLPTYENPVNGETLVSGTDYLVAYADNVNAGTATVTVTFIGNYTGTLTRTFEIAPQSVSIAARFVSGTDVIYNGVAQTPALLVTAGDLVLDESDYTAVYTSNTDVGTATVEVTARSGGNYVFEGCSLTFRILPATVTDANSSVPSVVYNREAQTPGITVSGFGALISGTDYVAVYTDNVNAGTAQATFTFSGNFAGTVTKTFTISPKNVSDAKVSAAGGVYNGAAHRPDVTVYDGALLLSSATDYTFVDINNIHAGRATVRVTFHGNYTGTADGTFVISPMPVVSPDVTVKDAEYTGEQVLPETSVVFNGVSMIEGIHYAVTGTDNVNVADDSHVTLVFIGDYTGTLTLPFEIVPKLITEHDITIPVCPYTGEAQTPALVVKDGDSVLEADRDYVVSYTDNVAIGTANAHVVYVGNYAGETDAPFAIGYRPLTNVTVTVSDVTYTGEALIPEIIVADGSVLLTSGTDYEVVLTDNVNAGTAKAQITFIGVYRGATETDFTVHPKYLEDPSVTVAEAVFDFGNPVTPGITVADGETELKPGTDYDVVFRNNVNAGTATVEVTPKGNYAGGPFTRDFTVKQLKITVTPEDVAVPAVTYAGSAQTPAVTVTVGEYILSENEYTAVYENNVNAGTAAVTLYPTATGNVTFDSVTVPFAVNPFRLDTCTVLLDETVFTYDGTAKQPAVTVTAPFGETVPVTAYTVVYTDNVNAGTAAVTVTMNANGNYSGTATVNFTIERAAYSQQELDAIGIRENTVEYDGNEHLFTVDGTLPAGVTAVYETNAFTKPGTYEIKVSFVTDANHLPIDDMSFTVEIHRTCRMHVALIILFALIIAFTLICFFVLKKKKHDLLTLIGFGILTAALIVFAILGHCTVCVVFTVLDAVAVVGGFLLIFFAGKRRAPETSNVD